MVLCILFYLFAAIIDQIDAIIGGSSKSNATHSSYDSGLASSSNTHRGDSHGSSDSPTESKFFFFIF